MHIVRLKISGFRGVRSADITLGRHAVLVGPNNSGKTTVIEALALLFGRDRLVRRLPERPGMPARDRPVWERFRFKAASDLRDFGTDWHTVRGELAPLPF